MRERERECVYAATNIPPHHTFPPSLPISSFHIHPSGSHTHVDTRRACTVYMREKQTDRRGRGAGRVCAIRAGVVKVAGRGEAIGSLSFAPIHSVSPLFEQLRLVHRRDTCRHVI